MSSAGGFASGSKACHIPDLAPAHRGLLGVLRAAAEGRASDAPPADWAAVLDLAVLHQVDGYLYPLVREWAPACQPAAPLMARWRTAFLGAVSLYTRAAVQAHELLATLTAAGVRVIPLKGIWLAERVYQDGACRPMSDIDLLVSAAELPRARAAIERLGYTTADYYVSQARDHHVRYQRPDKPLPVELHWSLWHAGHEAVGKPELAHVWTGLHEELLHGVFIQAFPPERQVVYLAQHILKHALTVPLKSYLDLVLLCRTYAPEFDLIRLEHEASALRVAFGTRFVLQMAFDILGESPPAPLASFLQPGIGGDKARDSALRTALQLTHESRLMTPALEAFHHASWSRRLRIGLARLLYSPSEIRGSYPRAVHRWGLAGGYIGRCADLVRRHGQVWRKAAGEGTSTGADLANYATRRSLSAWIRAQEPQ